MNMAPFSAKQRDRMVADEHLAQFGTCSRCKRSSPMTELLAIGCCQVCLDAYVGRSDARPVTRQKRHEIAEKLRALTAKRPSARECISALEAMEKRGELNAGQRDFLQRVRSRVVLGHEHVIDDCQPITVSFADIPHLPTERERHASDPRFAAWEAASE